MRSLQARPIGLYVAIGVTGVVACVSAVAVAFWLCDYIEGPFFDWLPVAVAISTAAFGVCISRLIGRRPVAADRHTCKRCGYDLRLIASDHCPECGGRIPVFARADEQVLAALRGRDVQNAEAFYIAPEDTSRSAPAADPKERLTSGRGERKGR
jgi:hypothetical protein